MKEAKNNNSDNVPYEEGRTFPGKLKIFFGYANGVGKTAAMLNAAHDAQKRGTDVVIGYIEPNSASSKLLKGLTVLPDIKIEKNGRLLSEFDLNNAVKRNPQLIIVDELAHKNADFCRHDKRYQDVKELLQAGIDVYTTVNVQDIESLNDIISAITGAGIENRIPDSVFDSADQVELIDLEPTELIERLKTRKSEIKKYYKKETEQIFTVENLTALRGIALRRCADRVERSTCTDRSKGSIDFLSEEHILVCMSPSPSNEKIIRTAARMANAFHGAFTALFVETSDYAVMDEKSKSRLRSNIHLAQQLGAAVETVYGDDIAFQISEFARLSGVSKIVIGRSSAARRHFLGKLPLTEQLIAHAPNLDIYVIQDHESNPSAYHKKTKKRGFAIQAADLLKCIIIIAAASGLGYLFKHLGAADSNIITVYVLAVLITSLVTVSRIYSLIASVISVLVFNFLFTDPKFTFLTDDRGYSITFLVMFIAALLTGTLASKLKSSAKHSARSAVRTKILFEANQMIQQAKDREEIIQVTARQLIKLLNRNIVIYPAENGNLLEPVIFPRAEDENIQDFTVEDEKEVAQWVFRNNRHAGATTETFSYAKCLYLAIRVNSVYGVVGIQINKQPLDAFENSILLSILGECALALENEKNAHEKEEAAIMIKNEKLRANLLRAISHDLRTPLTAISGNASNLLYNGSSFDEKTKTNLYQYIYDDSMWLINLVENLLSVTRLEEGKLNLNITAELVDEVLREALKHINRLSTEHTIKVHNRDDLLLAKMDARLIVQVLINLVDNAIKYTPRGSEITITAKRSDCWAVISVADNGPGIPEEHKKQVFDMFYSGANKIADSRRSLGLGLSLCKSIINAHGGTISVSDNIPHGSVFTFTLPVEEIKLHE